MALVFDKRPKLLVIDDEEGYRTMLETNMYSEGFQVVCAATSLQAKSLLASHKDIDIIVCDIQMPKESGVQFLGWLRGSPQFKKIPVIMVTACNEEERVKACARYGISGYLVKPFRTNDLVVKIQSVLIQQGVLRDPDKSA